MTTTQVTHEQARLALTLLNGPVAVAGTRALNVLFRREQPLSFEEYEQAYPVGSPEDDDLQAALTTAELLGTFVKLGLLPRALVDELVWVEGTWAQLAPVARGMREQAGEPRLFENAEALATGALQAGDVL